MVNDRLERRRYARVPVVRRVHIRLEGVGAAGFEGYSADLLDLGSGGLRCEGKVPFVPPGTRALVTLRVPSWVGSWRFHLRAVVARLHEHVQEDGSCRELALELLPADAATARRFNAYVRRARKAYHQLQMNQGMPSALAESFRILHASLGASGHDGARVILISSALPGEGKSFIAGNLAVLLAQEGHRVLLVEADLKRPSQHVSFGVQPKAGLAQWLRNGLNAEVSALALKTGTGVHLVPAGDPSAYPAEVWPQSSTDILVDQLKKSNYQFVILDTPPVLLSAATHRLAAAVDDVLLVVRAGSSRERSIREAKSLLDRNGARLRGIVLNGHGGSFQGYRSYYGTRSKRMRRPSGPSGDKEASIQPTRA